MRTSTGSVAPFDRHDLRDSVAVVSGGAGGIGRSVALSLAEAGVGLVVVDMNESGALKVAETASAMGVRSLAVAADATDLESMQAAASSTYEMFGRVSILVNSIGVTLRPFRATWDADPLDLKWVMDANFWSFFNLIKAFLPRMLEESGFRHVVVISSMVSMLGIPGHAPYVASKAAVDGMSRSLREELKHLGIGVTSVHPGSTRTKMVSSEEHRPFAERSRNRQVKAWKEYGANDDRSLSYLQEIDPVVIGPMVVDAVQRNYDYVLTHPAPAETLRSSTQEVIDSFRDGASFAARLRDEQSGGEAL